MADFGEANLIAGRKNHRCEACYMPIPKGEKHYHFQGRYDDEWQNWRMHLECYASYAADGYGDFMPGEFEAPERVLAQKGG